MQSFTAFLPDSMLSVAGLNAYIQSLFEDDQHLQQVWVMGEVSSANRYRSGLFLRCTTQMPWRRCIVWCGIAYSPA